MPNRETPSHVDANRRLAGVGAWGQAPISTIMTRNVAVVPDGLSLVDLSRFLLGARTTSAAVCDDAGAMVGHVSMIDIVRQQCRDDRPAVVRDVMRPFLLRVREDASIDKAAALMAFENIDRVFVVSSDGAMVGWVCALDVLRGAALHDGYPGIQGAGTNQDETSFATHGSEADRAR